MTKDKNDVSEKAATLSGEHAVFCPLVKTRWVVFARCDNWAATAHSLSGPFILFPEQHFMAPWFRRVLSGLHQRNEESLKFVNHEAGRLMAE